MFFIKTDIAKDNADALYKTFHQHMREMSWESCFALFQKAWSGNSVPHIDLARELFVYLASFGMLRNSPLLDVHYSAFEVSCSGKRPLIEVLMDPKFALLRAPAPINVANVPLVMELAAELEYSLSGAYLVCGHDERPTSTMVTKIILGTFGATPAYDTRVKASLKTYGGIQNFGENSLRELYGYYAKHSVDLDPWRKSHTLIKAPSLVYPEMRFLDMALW